MADGETCPRCSGPLDRVLYGPCPDCIAQLRAEQRGEARATEASVYEPKMNVTPNAVATKE